MDTQAKETGLPDGVSSCGRRVRAFLDCGAVWLICTLEEDHSGNHYDDAFCVPWKEIEKNTDKRGKAPAKGTLP